MADDEELGQRLMDYDGRDLEQGLRLAQDLVRAGRWDSDVAHMVHRSIILYHGHEGERRLDEAVTAAEASR